MESEEQKKLRKVSKEEFDVISNRIAVALAQREALIKSWTASSSKSQEPTKTEEELDAEDAILFRNQPQYLGVGAPIPAEFLVSDAERNKKALRAKFFPGRGLKANKARDTDEKAASAKRGLKHDSSDEEEGRSGLGKSKKQRTTLKTEEKVATREERSDADADEEHIGGLSIMKHSSQSKIDKRRDRSESEKKHKTVESNIDVTSKIEARLQHLLSGSTNVLPSHNSQMGEEEYSAADKGPIEPNRTSKLSVERPEDQALDLIERKKMKKREKKKRAKLRAAALALKK